MLTVTLDVATNGAPISIEGVEMRTTIRQWAATVGISRQAGYRAVARCEIPVDDCGGIDSEEATTLYRARTRARANPPRVAQRGAHEADFVDLGTVRFQNAPSGARAIDSDESPSDARSNGAARAGDPYWTARVRREQAQAELAELELARARGTLVDIEAARAEFVRRVIGARDLLLSVAARLAPVVAAESDLRRVRELLDAEMRRALSMLSGDDEPAAAACGRTVR